VPCGFRQQAITKLNTASQVKQELTSLQAHRAARRKIDIAPAGMAGSNQVW